MLVTIIKEIQRNFKIILIIWMMSLIIYIYVYYFYIHSQSLIASKMHAIDQAYALHENKLYSPFPLVISGNEYLI